MAACNTGRFVDAALTSLGAQTFSNFKLIVVDNRSTDDTWQIISHHTRGDA